jgi:predicted nucleotidyltransferase
MPAMSSEHLTDQTLDEIVRVIVREVDPQSIILFGSRARGDARPDSDVDLLIVRDRDTLPRQPRYMVTGRLYNLLSHVRVSKDILIYTTEEVEGWKDCKNHVIAHALREGQTLYERA